MDLPSYGATNATAKEVVLLGVYQNKLYDHATLHSYMSTWQDEMDLQGAMIWTCETIHMPVPLCALMWKNVPALDWPRLPNTRTFVVES
jgi:hypothetical protein